MRAILISVLVLAGCDDLSEWNGDYAVTWTCETPGGVCYRWSQTARTTLGIGGFGEGNDSHSAPDGSGEWGNNDDEGFWNFCTEGGGGRQVPALVANGVLTASHAEREIGDDGLTTNRILVIDATMTIEGDRLEGTVTAHDQDVAGPTASYRLSGERTNGSACSELAVR